MNTIRLTNTSGTLVVPSGFPAEKDTKKLVPTLMARPVRRPVGIGVSTVVGRFWCVYSSRCNYGYRTGCWSLDVGEEFNVAAC